jgi:hypothetical protein
MAVKEDKGSEFSGAYLQEFELPRRRQSRISKDVKSLGLMILRQRRPKLAIRKKN